MRILFQVEESFEAILKQVKEDSKFWESVSREVNRDMKYRLHDRDFPDSWTEVIVVNEKYSSSTRTMFIETAWSRFKYEISQSIDEKTMVVYNGAYRGLLEQVLLPQLTPIDLLSASVQSSLGSFDSLKKYAGIQNKLYKFKVDNELNVHIHAHPGCVFKLLQTNEKKN